MPEVTVNNGTVSIPVSYAGSSFTVPVSFAAVGPAGAAGEGVPPGGTTGQILAKASGTNYDTEWITAAGTGDLLASNNLSDVDNAATAFANIKQAATTAATGVVELATDGESSAGVVVQGNDSRLSDARDPNAHASNHTDGTDDIQSATNAQKGLATAAHITAIEANAAKLTCNTANVTAAGALMDSEVTNLAAVKAFDPTDYDAAGSASGAVSTHAAATSGVHGISTFGASLIDDASASAARTTLELGTAATSATGDFEAAGAVSTHAALTATHGVSGAIVGTTDAQTLTNKVINGASNTLTVRLASDVTGDLPLANLAQASAASKLLGRGSAAAGGDFEEISLGSGLSMSGTTLSASASAPAMADIADYTETAVSAGEVVAYTGAGYENQALAELNAALGGIAAGTWTGATSITTLGTIATGTWQGTAIGDSYISSAATWNAKQSEITFGTGVETALGVNIGSAGAPVLLNGAGGTPSALTLTNATGLPLSSGVTGTLPIANGGTGGTSLPTPSNYTPASATVSGHLSGIDTALSSAGGGGSAPQYLRLSADFATSSTSFADVDNGSGDDLIFTVSANTVYRLEVIGPAVSSTVTEAFILGVNGPTASFVMGEAAFPNASLASPYTYAIQSYDDMPTSPGNGPGATADSSCRMNVIVSIGGAGGSLAVRLRAETGGANSVTLKAGTIAILTELSAA